MKRTCLMGVLALALLMFAAAASPSLAVAQVFTDGVASGDVTSTGAILWTRVDGGGQAKVEVWNNPGLTGKKAFQRNTQATAARDFTVKIDATGLTPNTTYFYRFKHETESGTELSPVGTFKTAPSSSTAADVKFTYTGDSDGTKVNGSPFHNNFEVLNQARLENGDFFVYLGDTIYSDSGLRPGGPATTLPQYRATYRENRTYSNLTDLLKSTSTYPQQDDHEVQNDYDGQTVNPARYAAGIGAFLEYMPLRESNLLNDSTCAGKPLFRVFQWGSDVDVIIPDERSCRSASVEVTCQGDLAPTLPAPFRVAFGLSASPPPGCLAAINDPVRTMLGPVQKQAFKNALMNSTAKFKFVMSELAIQQFWALPYDRWEGYAAERLEILNFIQGNSIDNVVFLTTDNHATLQNQVFRDRFENCTTLSQSCAFVNPPDTIGYELVSGPIATFTLQEEILILFGAQGPQRLEQFNQALDLAGMDCRDLNRDSYGLASSSATAGTATIASKDANGAVITDKRPGPDSTGTCTKGFGP